MVFQKKELTQPINPTSPAIPIKPEEKKQVLPSQWNLSEDYISQIAGFLRDSSVLYREGDFYNSFIALEEIKTLINHDLDATEQNESNTQVELIKRVNHQVARLSSIGEELGLPPKQARRLQQFKSILMREIEIYKRMLVGYLNMHGYGVQRKADITSISNAPKKTTED